jgi:hypothetical protein
MSNKYNPAKPKEEQIELLSDEELLAILADEDDTEDNVVLDVADMSDYPKMDEVVDPGLEHRGIKIYTKLRNADSYLPKTLPEYDPDEYYVVQWLVQYAGLEPGTDYVVPRAWLFAAYNTWLNETFPKTRVKGILRKKEPCYLILKKFFPVGVTHITNHTTGKHAAVMDDSLPVTAQRWDVGVSFKPNSPYNYRKLMELGLPKLTSQQIDKRLEKEKEEAEVAAYWRKVRYEKEKRREQWRRNMQIHEERKAKKAAWKAKQEAKYEKYGKVAPWLKSKSESSE